MKVGQKVWEIRINRPTKGLAEGIFRKEGLHIFEYEILGINSRKLVLNDDYFSTFYVRQGSKKSWENYLDDIFVRIATNEDYFANGVFISVYSTKKPSKALLTKMVETANKKIDDLYGSIFGEMKSELYNIIEGWEK